MFNVSAQHPGTRALLQKGSRSPHWDPLSVLEAAKELVSDLFRKDPGPRSGSFMPDVDAALRAIANSKVEQDLRFLETPWRAVHQTQQAALGVPLGTSAGNISDAWDVDRYVDGKVEDFAISKLKQGLGWFSRDAKNRQTPASGPTTSSS